MPALEGSNHFNINVTISGYTINVYRHVNFVVGVELQNWIPPSRFYGCYVWKMVVAKFSFSLPPSL
jgi:hypothetical protein